MSCEPHKFTAEAEHSPVAAKAKLMFTALGYINNVLGYSIIDFNHEVKNYIDNHIRQFDNQMDLVRQFGSLEYIMHHTVYKDDGGYRVKNFS